MPQQIQPGFDLAGFGWVLLPGAFNACLDFAQGHRGQG